MATVSAKKKKKIKKIVKRCSLLFLALIVFVSLVMAAVRGISALNTAKDAKHKAEEMIVYLKSGDYDRAKIDARYIHFDIKDLKDFTESGTGKVGIGLIKLFTKLDSDVDTGLRLLDIADEMLDKYLDSGFDLLREYPPDQLKVNDGYNVALVSEYLDYLESIMPDVEATVEEVSGMTLSIDKTGIFSGAVEKVNALMDLYNDAKEWLPFIKEFLGDGEDRTYLIAAQNSAEIRASGGFPGAMGKITIKDGVLSIGDFTSVWLLLPLTTPTEYWLTGEELDAYDWWPNLPRDACYCPNFERTAWLWEGSYYSMWDEHLDGIISLTPAIIQDILAITGGITLSDGTYLDGTNATKELQNGLYIKYQNAEAVYEDYESANEKSDALFSETAHTTLSKLFSSINIDSIPYFIDMVEENIENRVIMVWMRDEAEEELVKSYGMSGGMNTDEENPAVGVFIGNDVASKLGWYLDMDVTLSSGRLQWDDSVEYTVTVTLKNTIDYYTIQTAGYWIIGAHEDGALNCYLTMFAPAGGTISDFEVSIDDAEVTESYLYGLEMGYLNGFKLGALQTVTVTFNITTAPGVKTVPTVYHTPLLTEYR